MYGKHGSTFMEILWHCEVIFPWPFKYIISTHLFYQILTNIKLSFIFRITKIKPMLSD